MNFNQRHILITGGAGFFGSFLTEEMLKLGAQVTIFDLFLQGRSRIEHVSNHPSLKIIQGDLLTYPEVLKAMEGIDFVWHLASNTDIPLGLRDTRVDLNHGVIATHHVLEAMRAKRVRQMMFPSSGAIYGEKLTGFRSEALGPTLPI